MKAGHEINYEFPLSHTVTTNLLRTVCSKEFVSLAFFTADSSKSTGVNNSINSVVPFRCPSKP